LLSSEEKATSRLNSAVDRKVDAGGVATLLTGNEERSGGDFLWEAKRRDGREVLSGFGERAAS
jgi:hypothetical protein